MKRFILVTLALCLFTASVLAQSNTGNLVGTVSDPTGVIPGATVVVTDNKTGREKTVTTNAQGEFSIPQLEVGTYTVKITAAGHKTFTATDVKIDVGKDYALNPTLEAGNIMENVTVVAGADIINSTSGELSNTVSPRQVLELPLNGRNPLSLVLLQPGTSSNSAQNTTINGQRASFTNITRDGLNVQDNFIRSNAVDFIPDRPNVDDTGEFTIVTQNAGAELGYGSSQVQLVTPRGSNGFHGAVYEYNRNSKFAANNFFNNLTGTPRPFLNRNQFGGKLGGPILKNKLFFFASTEIFRLRQSTVAQRTILLPGARNGVFTYRDNTPASAGGPQLRTVNVLTLAGVSSDPLTGSRVLANVPTVGNRTDIGDQLNTTGLSFNQKQNQNREAFTSRFDYDISSKQSINGVFSYKKEFLLRPDVDAQQGGAAAGFNPTPFGFQDAHTPFLALSWRWSPTTSLTNEVRGGWQRSDPTFNRTNQPTDFFIQIPLISNPESGFQIQGRKTNIYNVQDNAVYSRGQHSFRFGGTVDVFRINPFGPGAFGSPTIPNFVLGTNVNTPALAPAQFPGGISSPQLTNANNLLALLGGIISSANQQFNATSKTSGLVAGALPNRNLNFEHYSGYIADQWRTTPRLTLNLGLRYELFTAIREPNGLALEPVIPSGTDIKTAVLNPNGTFNFVGGNAGGGNKFFKTEKDNFAPVLSFAYSPQFKNKFLGGIFPGGGKTVIRGGFRQSLVNDEFVRAADNALLNNVGLSLTSNALNPATGTTSLNGRFNALPVITAPAFQVPRTFAQNNTAQIAGRFGAVFAIDPNLHVPRTSEYNFSIEREIGFQTAIEVRYVGGRSNNLVRAVDFNQVDIFNNGFLADFNRARANFVLTGNPACTIAGCQPLTVFPNLAGGGLLNNSTIRGQIQAGTPADLAILYVTNGLTGSVNFLPNPNTGVADVLSNSAKYRYNALQVEVRRRFAQGFSFQANYTFQKTLTDAGGTNQTRVDVPLDINNLNLELSRAIYDQTHVFNLNTIYELPFGKGKRWLNRGGALDRLVGGFQITSIIRAATGAPMSITDPRGTLNRVGRSGNQTANSSLTKDQIKNLIGVFRTPCGIFFINPSVIDINTTTCTGSGRGAPGFGQPPFPGQVFFNVPPGQTGSLERFFINGPFSFEWDASVIKDIRLTERVSLQLRAEAFNVLNRANFGVSAAGQTGVFNINSSNFGRLTFTDIPRIIQFVGRIEF